MNKKTSITISVPNNTTQEEIKEIRQLFKESQYSKDHMLNIIVSGHEDHIENLGAFLMAWIKK